MSVSGAKQRHSGTAAPFFGASSFESCSYPTSTYVSPTACFNTDIHVLYVVRHYTYDSTYVPRYPEVHNWSSNQTFPVRTTSTGATGVLAVGLVYINIYILVYTNYIYHLIVYNIYPTLILSGGGGNCPQTAIALLNGLNTNLSKLVLIPGISLRIKHVY